MKKLLLVCIASTILGCAAPEPSMMFGVPNTTESTDVLQVRAKKKSLESKRQELLIAKMQEEINRLKKEISELEKSISEIESRLSIAERRALLETEPSTSRTAPTSATGRIGPRGGCYTITKSGKKNYAGC